MFDPSIVDFGHNARRLRVDTLVRLRWLAVAGQLVAILIVYYGFGFPLPISACLIVVVVSAALNIGLRVRFERNHRLTDWPATTLLTFDLLQLASLLYLTGGLDNPFVVLALAPVVIGAVSLSRWQAAYLVALMIGLTLLLAFHHWPMPWVEGAALSLPPIYRAAIWIALGLAGVFVALYAGRVAQEARLLSDALAATELVLAREQHLSQLDGLAAAAAHELGTPLATIALVAKELTKRPDTPPASDDLELLSQQVRRCREILGKLTSLGDDPESMLAHMTLGVLLEEVVQPHRNFDVSLKIVLDGLMPEPICLRNPGMLYGLGNLIENAVDFARSTVEVRADWDASEIIVTIADDGPGFAPDILSSLGEPYVTTRAADRRAKVDETTGLGLGLFIAKTLLERSGARITIANKSEQQGGASIQICWPRAEFERDPSGVL
ncbi:MAG: ActS/PrrB/RegB family redox-sensitive histidine kinase [Rhodoblastus sp.]